MTPSNHFTPWRYQPADPIPTPGYAYQVSATGPTPWPVALAVLPADARLIAAAPDLLRVCRLVLTRLDLAAAERPGAIFPAAALRSDLRAAINKATTDDEEEAYEPSLPV